jgi:hypothetical protein
MIRIACLVTYLTAAAGAVLLFNADQGNSETAMVIWGLASLLLGWGTGWPLWAFLAFLAVPFAMPFGVSNEYLGSDGPYVAMLAFVCAIGSAILIAVSAGARMIVDDRRRAAAER